MSVPTFRLFLSSPGDVAVERRRVAAAVGRLNGEFAGRAALETIRWETENYQAHSTFQTQIPQAVGCDIVLAIFKWRLGTELPPDFPDRMATGEPYPSGTAYELLTAIAQRQAGGALPDVFVYRYGGSSPRPELDDPNRERIEREWGVLKGFFQRWFLTAQGHFKAAFQTYRSEDEFEARVDALLRRWLADKVSAGRVVAWPDAVKGSPFPGLEAYGFRHAPVFFGRGRDVSRAVDLWREAGARGCPVLTVVGSSGAGKSSLARAGLVPRLVAAGVVEGVDLWRVAVLRPGDSPDGPVAALAAALLAGSRDLPASEEGRGPALPEIAAGDARTPAELAELLAHGGPAASRPVVNALDRIGEAARRDERVDRPVRCDLLLLVDQLDEVFAPSLDPERRDGFVRILSALARTGRVWIVTTLRADLYAAMLEHPGLRALKEAGASYDLAAPGAAELAKIVRRPAEAADLVFEADPQTGEGLDERLLREADRPDMLPLVQLALARLYEGRRQVGGRTILPVDVYGALGGLPGIIDEAGERALSGLGAAEIDRLPQLVRGLAELDAPTPLGGTLAVRPVPLGEAATDPERRRLVDALVSARLLTVSGAGEGGQVRLAHQRVLADWKRAHDIVVGSADFYRVRMEVERQRHRWEANRRADLLLPRGLPLAEALSILARYPDDLRPETRAFIRASRARAGRSQLLTAAAAVVFAFVAVGALLQWWVARQQTRLAERNFGIARDSVKSLVIDVAQGLRDVSGMRIEAVRQVLQTVAAASDKLLASAPDDPELLRSRAVMFDNFARTYASAGDVTAARGSAEEAVRLVRRLQALQPGRERIDADLSVVLVTLGSAIQQSGALGEALAVFADALAAARREVARTGDAPLARESVANVLDKIGGAELLAGDRAKALAAYTEMLDLIRSGVAALPPDVVRLSNLASALSSVADVTRSGGDAAGARALYEEAAAVARKLAADYPANAGAQHTLSVSLTNLGDLDLAAGRPGDAVPRYDEAVAIERGLLRRDPSNTDHDRNLGICLEKRGDAAFALADWAGAAAAFAEELAIFRRLVVLDPADLSRQRSLSIALERSVDILKETGDRDGAAAALRELVELRRMLLARQGDNADIRRDLSVALQKLADARHEAGDIAGALSAYREALDLSRALARANPDSFDAQNDLRGMLDEVVGLQQQEKDLSGALATRAEHVGVVRRILSLRPGDPVWRRQLVRALLSQAILRFSADGDPRATLPDLAEAVDLLKGLLAQSDDPALRTLLANASSFRANMAGKAGDPALARVALAEVVAQRRRLAAAGAPGGHAALASALAAQAALEPDPAAALREAAALLDGLGEGERTAETVALRGEVGRRLAALPPG